MTNSETLQSEDIFERFARVSGSFPAQQLRDWYRKRFSYWSKAFFEKTGDAPVVFFDNRVGTFRFYIFCPDKRKMRDVFSSVQKWLSPTYVRLNPPGYHLNEEDPVGEFLDSKAEGSSFRIDSFDPRGDKQAKIVSSALTNIEYLMEVAKPKKKTPFGRPIARLLRDFRMALEFGNETRVLEVLEEISSSRMLEADNVRFLEIESLARFGRWEKILKLPYLNDLLKIPFPRRTATLIAKALFEVNLRGKASEKTAEEFLRLYRETVHERFVFLPDDEALCSIKEHGLCALARDITLNKTDSFFLSLWHPEKGWEEPYKALFEKLKAKLRKLADQRPSKPAFQGLEKELTQARSAFSDYRFSDAFALAKMAPPSPSRTVLLLQCSKKLETLESYRVAAGSFLEMEAEDQQILLGQRSLQKIWEEFCGISPIPADLSPEDLVPEDLFSLLESAEKGFLRSSRVRHLLEIGSNEWDTRILVQKIDERNSILDFYGKEGLDEVFYNRTLPYLARLVFRAEETPSPKMKSMYEDLLNILFLTTEGGEEDFALCFELMDRWLSLGVKPEPYRKSLEEIKGMLGLWNTPKSLDWELDFSELLLNRPCPKPEYRKNFILSLIGPTRTFHVSKPPYWWRLAKEIVEHLQEKPEFFEFPKSLQELDHELVEKFHIPENTTLKVGVYSLEEKVILRVKTLLETVFSKEKRGFKVKGDSSHGGSKNLENLAKESDLLVVVPACAKHAATDFIKQKRPMDKPTLYSPGRGSASILRVIQEYLVKNL